MKLSIRKKPATLAENTIPLINVVFLMLIFFLIAGSLAAPLAPGLAPPETATLPPAPARSDVVQIVASGEIYYLGETLGREALLARLAEIGPPDIRLIADKALPADDLIALLEALRAAGHEKIRLMTLAGAP